MAAVLFVSHGTAGVPIVGEPAPSLSLEAVLQAPAGTRAGWEELRGNVVVLEFWATWCAPCIQAIPHVNELAKAFVGKPVRFIAITDEPHPAVQKFLARKPIDGWVGLDGTRTAFHAFGVAGIPRTFLIDAQGRIAAITEPSRLSADHIENVLAGREAGLPAVEEDADRVYAGTLPGDSASGEAAVFSVLIRPSSATERVIATGGAGMSALGPQSGYTGIGCTLPVILTTAFDVRTPRIVMDSEVPTGKFDVVVKLPTEQRLLLHRVLEHAVEATFGLVGKREKRTMAVNVLRATASNAPRLERTGTPNAHSSSIASGKWSAVNISMKEFAADLEDLLGSPVVDETRWTGAYDFELDWEPSGDLAADTPRIARAVHDQLGLEIAPATRAVDVVVVRRNSKSE